MAITQDGQPVDGSTRNANVYLVRHGRTTLNAEGCLRGRLDPPLDAVGHVEAAALAASLAALPVDLVATSPLLRARETALAISAAHRLEPEVVKGLTDRDYGAWAGVLAAEVVERFGSVDQAPGVEPWPDFEARVAAAFDGVIERSDATTIVVVAHDAVNRALLTRLFGRDSEGVAQDTGCFNELRRDDGHWTAVAVNRKP